MTAQIDLFTSTSPAAGSFVNLYHGGVLVGICSTPTGGNEWNTWLDPNNTSNQIPNQFPAGTYRVVISEPVKNTEYLLDAPDGGVLGGSAGPASSASPLVLDGRVVPTPKPSGLTYAFDGVLNSGDRMNAYVVTDASTAAQSSSEILVSGNAEEVDATLAAGFDYSTTAGDGHHPPLVGEYLIFRDRGTSADNISAIGWDPFDPANTTTSPSEPTVPSDPNAPATEPDTTVGGGGDFTPGSDDPAYEAPPDQTGPAVVERETDTTSGGSAVGGTGDTDSHARDPQPLDDTTIPSYGQAYRTGDTDDHTKDPVDYSTRDTTVLGGGVSASSTGQAYRAPSNPPEASNFDTTARSGIVRVNPGSPDAAVVGSGSGLNPNAVEPAMADASYDAGSGQRDTTYAGSPAFTTVPAQAGNPAAPGKPTVAAISGRAAATVTWTAPADAVAKGVVGYVVTSNTGGETEVGKNSLSVEFEQGLVPGQTYTFTVFARTSNGTGPRSTPSDPFLVPKDDILLADTQPDEGLQGPAQSLPGAPAAPVATVASATSVSVAITAPASDGGSPITGYVVTSTPGGKTASGTTGPLVVTGLTTSTAYTFTVQARNGYGLGAASAASNSVTPA